MKKILIFFAILGILIAFKILMFRCVPFIDQYVFNKELDLPKRYGKGSWVLITGPSSGMGERFAYEFADRGFNLILVGSKRTKRVIKRIKNKVLIKFIEVDFTNGFNDGFFDPIQKAVDDVNLTILINNVGYRTACIDYKKMSVDEMKKTITVGTIIQSKLIQMALRKFSVCKEHTAIVNITALNSVYTDLFAIDNDLTVPYLACYEASNAYGYFHAKSVYAEIKNKHPLIDFLIITPGAVSTKHTEVVLNDTLLSIDVDTYIKNILKLMGNYNGPRCAHWGHSISSCLINIAPWFDKESVLKKVGEDFAKLYEK